MDHMQFAALSRARTALDVMVAGESDASKVKAFTDIAFAMMVHNKANIGNALRNHASPLVQKAAAHALSDDVWTNDDAAALAAAYIGSIAEGSLLEQIVRYGNRLPLNLPHVMVASGFSADVIAEGDPKVVKHMNLGLSNVSTRKAAAIIVLTNELIRAAGGRTLFETELRKAVTRAINASVLDQLTDSDTISIPGSGDALADLRAGLYMAGPSAGYVVAMPAADVLDLSLRQENRGGMGVRGGTFVPGVEIVAMDEITDIHVIPASQVSVLDGGLQVRGAEHATVTMADSPTSPSELVSLWQTNSTGLLAERNFFMSHAAPIVIVQGGS
ncbi:MULTISPECIES: hypothetical protein [Stenotrophomonas maltophilia group]|uniref:hypothetical protein n=1 Tax=Stenotrophomonas maltophilia group TaxID=995085 RepID=UPI000DA980FD|nr:hypothetical protein [Stenotrophomonas maltophilia]PZS68262.1 hypothetical protein A7X76_13910 [Stenotrophomonas maltophilia]PZS98680.1 hypothetical protein A7X66_05465 [Stenotrophomonas maltophilia]